MIIDILEYDGEEEDNSDLCCYVAFLWCVLLPHGINNNSSEKNKERERDEKARGVVGKEWGERSSRKDKSLTMGIIKD